jgi:hypothetical protein
MMVMRLEGTVVLLPVSSSLVGIVLLLVLLVPFVVVMDYEEVLSNGTYKRPDQRIRFLPISSSYRIHPLVIQPRASLSVDS